MLIQMLIQQPQMLGTVLKNTPLWVGGLFAALIALGLSQVRSRTAGLARVTVVPAVMTTLSLLGTVSTFGGSPLIGSVLLAWLAAAAASLAIIATMAAPAGTLYDAATRKFHQPGSWVPMLLILGIFLTKYIGGVDLAMQPGLARDAQYTLTTAVLYGLFSGIFIGRAARLWRIAYRRPNAPANRPFTA
ncbi:MAG TPA: DUF6622 family protein [Ramlibacter sp.]|nr:DUF6622 family protein [Ramlibacter sp.]